VFSGKLCANASPNTSSAPFASMIMFFTGKQAARRLLAKLVLVKDDTAAAKVLDAFKTQRATTTLEVPHHNRWRIAYADKLERTGILAF
jgi:hypothetical protein